jgi:hypothetical protein
MDEDRAKELLDILLENTSRLLNADFGLNYVAATFFDVVNLLRDEPFLKGCFLERVRATFVKRDAWYSDAMSVPIELVELVTHEFRWNEILDMANERVNAYFGGDKSLAFGDISQRVFAAYEADWEDRDLYDVVLSNVQKE